MEMTMAETTAMTLHVEDGGGENGDGERKMIFLFLLLLA
jgi:hypothetical protein